jgi:hypothetical protein
MNKLLLPVILLVATLASGEGRAERTAAVLGDGEDSLSQLIKFPEL